MNETTFLFGKENSLVGVLTQPEAVDRRPTAVIFLNAGLIHHVGPNRLYVRMARHLASLGMPVLRFDLSGIGDSSPRTDNLPFEQRIVDDTRQAMDELTKSQGVKNFILMGHCAGASESFMVAVEDQRVEGVVLINPESAQQDWMDYDRKRKVQQYYQNYYGKQVMSDPDRWHRFLTGKANYSSVIRNVFRDILWSKVTTILFKSRSRVKALTARPDPIQQQVINGIEQLRSRHIPVLFVYSAGSTGFELLKSILGKQFQALIDSEQVRVTTIDGTDHTFTLRHSQDRLMTLIESWCRPLINTLA